MQSLSCRPSVRTALKTSSLPGNSTFGLQLDDRLEPAPNHPLGVEGQALHVHHVGEARVLHHLRHDAIALLARLVDDPRNKGHLGRLKLPAPWERPQLTQL